MFRRKKKEEKAEDAPVAAVTPEAASVDAPAAEVPASSSGAAAAEAAPPASAGASAAAESGEAPAVKTSSGRGHRVQKVGTVASDKMQKTVIVRVDRLVLHRKYRRYVRRTSKFMAHDDLGATTGDRVRIVETRPLSANKRWRVVEILQKAAK
jgi:small subunit ribosomal protein S17